VKANPSVASSLQMVGLLLERAVDPPGPAGGHRGGTVAGKNSLKRDCVPPSPHPQSILHRRRPFASIVQRWLALPLNFGPPLIYATLTSRGKSTADSQFQPLLEPFGSVPGHCSASCRPRWSPGQAQPPTWIGERSSLGASTAPVSVPANSQAASKAIWQMGCKISVVAVARSPVKSRAELSDICLFACFGKRKKGARFKCG